jgi:ABC-2 type transport system permease protein
MMRYLRLFAAFVRFSFSRALEFRMDFFFRIGMDIIWNTTNLAFFWLVYQHTPLLGGWTFDQMLIFMGGVFVVDALHMTLFSNNIWWLPIYINRGDVDYHLVRPVSSLFMLSFREFAANSFVNLLIACGIFSWTLMRYPGELGAPAVALFIALLLVGEALHYALTLLFTIPTFWLHASSGLREVYWATEQYMTRPHGIFTGWMSRILVSILPFALIISFPVRILLEGAAPALLLHLLLTAALALLIMIRLWNAGVRSYSSASS